MYAGNSEGAVSSQWRASEMYAQQPAWHAQGPKFVSCARARPVHPRYDVAARGAAGRTRARRRAAVRACAANVPAHDSIKMRFAMVAFTGQV